MITVRTASDGSLWIPREDAETEEYLDSKYVRLPNQLRWVSRIPNILDVYGGIHINQAMHIIGKGPSLDRVGEKGEFSDGGPIICLNESIHKIEEMELSNPTYAVQLDADLKETCRPKKTTTKLFLSPNCGTFYQDGVTKIVVDPRSMNLPINCLSVQFAIALTKVLGCVPIILHCFDGCLTNNYEYASCVGYDSSKGGPKIRFKGHKQAIVEAAGQTKLIWVTADGRTLEPLG
jgi:hypothetical protein